MSDVEDLLRSAMGESVSQIRPPDGLMSAVRARHRRRRVTTVWSAVLAVGIIAGMTPTLVSSYTTPKPAATTATPVEPLFPGSGRLLLANAHGLYWLHADGRTDDFAPGYSGGNVVAGRLLVWKSDAKNRSTYYTMQLDGSGATLALPRETDTHFDDSVVRLSPDGARLAFIRRDSRAVRGAPDELWTVDLLTGVRHDLGKAFPTSIWWRDATTLLVTSADHRSLESVNLSTGARTTELSVSDARIAAEYRKARPSSGPPAFINADGWAPGSNSTTLAVWVAGSGATGSFVQPVEMLVAGGTVTTFAPPTRQQLELTWGPAGTFLLRTGAGDMPGSWNTYHGSAGEPELSPAIPFGETGANLSPDGTAIAIQDYEVISFIPVGCKGNACEVPVKQLVNRGALTSWEP